MILPEWANMCDAVMSKKSVTFRQIMARPTSTLWQHQLTKALVTSLLEVAAMQAQITGFQIDGTAAAIQLTLLRVSKALVTSLLEVVAMEAPITGLGIDGTAAAI